MQTSKPLFLLFLLSLGLAYVMQEHPEMLKLPTGGTIPLLQPDDCPNLVAAFSENDNRDEASHHAYIFGTICSTIADIIEADGKRTDPRFTKGIQLDDLRLRVREMRTGGWSFGTKYPKLRDEVGNWLDKKLQTGNVNGKPVVEGGPIDANKRAQWVAAYRGLASCSKYAAQAVK